jgi:hypothetical protein
LKKEHLSCSLSKLATKAYFLRSKLISFRRGATSFREIFPPQERKVEGEDIDRILLTLSRYKNRFLGACSMLNVAIPIVQ